VLKTSALIANWVSGVLASIIQACKPDARIAALCEQGDKSIQESVSEDFLMQAVNTSCKKFAVYVQGSEQGVQGQNHRKGCCIPNLHITQPVSQAVQQPVSPDMCQPI
jgi:hypothetical protein